MSSEEIKVDTSRENCEKNEDDEEVVEESHEDSDGYIEVKVNKNFNQKMSIFSNKIETNNDQGKFIFFILKFLIMS